MAIRKVGDCRILGPLGKGGMATVYRAVHEGLQREVAIKELPPDAAKNSEQLSRFKREAMALANFRHQHIVTLYDLVEKNDGLYMVMELVDGPSLAELIKEEKLPPDAVCVIGLQLAAALEHAHFHRVVHRDLKPANVMINSWGEVKLMDFGIAQQEDLSRLTKTGMAVGTPAYMSPEQVTGGAVDGRSDIYSLGVMLYEALSGKRPFVGATPAEVFAKITTGQHEVLHKASRAPKALAEVIEKAMSRFPQERFQDASALRRAFEELLSRFERSPSSVLVAFLRARQKLSESDVLARLSKTDLADLSQLVPAHLKPRKSRWGWAVLAGVLLGSIIASYSQWWPHVQPLIESVRKPK